MSISKKCRSCGKQFELDHNCHLYCSHACRFESKYEKRGPTECWPYQACRHAFGHGQFWNGTRVVYAHRFAWELINGPVPKGIYVCHRCDNPSCVNPEHLFLGTCADNLSDMRRKGRGSKPPRRAGEQHSMAVLTEDRVRTIRQSSLSSRQLADMFGVEYQTIWRVRKRQTWKHVV